MTYPYKYFLLRKDAMCSEFALLRDRLLIETIPVSQAVPGFGYFLTDETRREYPIDFGEIERQISDAEAETILGD